MTIKFLSDTIINRIAAGEVIERPSSVVKELVENSIDAGAGKIDIILERSGKNLIIVADDGMGMSPEELEIAVQRHTTSKLDEEDLLNIHSFGFRGEALPSIGSVSRMLITSKAKDSNKAWQIKLTGGKQEQLTPALLNQGTCLEIRDLFFATPARLKFLRTDKTELNACVEIVKKIALSHPGVSFTLTHDNKVLLKVKGLAGEFNSILKQRIIDILGQEFAENSAQVAVNRPELSIFGYVSIPTFNRATAEDQFLFINNRPVKDKVLNTALRVVYQDYLSRDRFPIATLFLQIDPQLVDVNVHPAKNEVRFYDPVMVRGILMSSIRDALATTSHKVATTMASNALGFFNSSSSPNQSVPWQKQLNKKTYYQQPASLSDNNTKGFKVQQIIKTDPLQQPTLIPSSPHARTASLEEATIPPEPQTGDGPAADFPLGAAKAQLHGTYIISQTNDSIIITDQHAAHERLGYEKIKQAIAKHGLTKQRLLIPEIIELPDERRASTLHEHKDELSKLGLTIEKFGTKSIMVLEMPGLIGDVNINQLIQDLADQIADIGENISLTALIEQVTETYACHYSVRAGRHLLPQEMNELLRQMEQTPFSGQCNHGRPTYVELKLKDIEKLFGRK